MTKASNVPLKTESGENSGAVTNTDVKGLLQNSQIKLHSPIRSENKLALRHSFLDVEVTATKLIAHGIISQKQVEIQMVKLKLRYVHSGHVDCSAFDVKP